MTLTKFDLPRKVTENYCETCYGTGMCSKYDLGWRSLVHSERLATLQKCPRCNGTGEGKQ